MSAVSIVNPAPSERHLTGGTLFLLAGLAALGALATIGGLYSFFAAAPGVLMNELGLTAFQLGLS
ncbi:MAG TPA: hypothetical protein VD840_10590, partial [Sinorhizobium sp.]|nr:hypothetical protein [Sinorhizobium sp.]